MSTQEPSVWLDHFVVAINDLNRGIKAFESLTGVTPILGGEHPTLGTCNALVSLGHQQYFEILAPRPGAALHPLVQGIDRFDQLTPFLWAVAVDDIQAVYDGVVRAGYDVNDIEPASRLTRRGDTLRWRMFTPNDDRLINAPFFMEWDGATQHPSQSTPTGCSVVSFSVTSPHHDNVQTLLHQFGYDVIVKAGDRAMEIRLATPKGTVTLG